jgi:hypothetical protein
MIESPSSFERLLDRLGDRALRFGHGSPPRGGHSNCRFARVQTAVLVVFLPLAALFQ